MTVNMKRRNAEYGKLRRPVKRNKITEGIYGSTFLYLKFLIVWILVMLADFILEFRFEYLWPFWLMMRSVYDSFKYQGFAFSVFFVCIAVTSDMVCYLFIPVQWLFFAASTYVWVQYVWHTERGICLPTVSLWLLFVYIEAAIRLREIRTSPFHLDLCRPFAAHCIGYPVVTLGFGFKSYISYKMRLRKQKDVQKENDFFMQLLNSALPVEQQQQQQQQQQAQQNAVSQEKAKALPSKSQEDVISNGHTPSGHKRTSSKTSDASATSDVSKKQQHIEDFEFIEQTPRRSNINDFDETADNYVNDQNVKNSKAAGMNKSSSTSKLNSQKDNTVKERKSRTSSSRDISASTESASSKTDPTNRLENDIKRLKADLQCSRNSEQELRSQVNSLLAGDKLMKSEVYQLRQDNENLQNKLHNLVTSRQQDKQSLLTAERKLQEERKLRTTAETQLSCERKAKKAEEAAAARAVALAAVARADCSESCKARRKDMEIDIQQINMDLGQRDDRIRQLEMEAQSLRQYKEAQNESEVLMSALAAMQDKNQHLENSLSAETRLKLELFSALGDAKRSLEIQHGLLNQKNKEIVDLKSKVAEAMALMPSTSIYPSQLSQMPPMLSSPKYCNGNMSPVQSNLNPNAIDYTPKSSA